MGIEKTVLHQRIEAGGRLVLAEIDPPHSTDPTPIRQIARDARGKVHALSVCDNRDRVRMAALAAANLVAGEGIEPILHVVTRDRNRIALVSDCLGAAALGIRNFLCTSGTHQTLGRFRAARNVYDLDAVQLLQAYAGLGKNALLVGEAALNGSAQPLPPLCLGAVAAPHADPPELQIMRLAKKVAAGAIFFVTQPVYDLERFEAWWREVVRHGLDKKAAIVAGIEPLRLDHEPAAAARAPQPDVPDSLARRLSAAGTAAAQRAVAIEIACETIGRLAGTPGLRGFQLSAGDDPSAMWEIIERSGLKAA